MKKGEQGSKKRREGGGGQHNSYYDNYNTGSNYSYSKHENTKKSSNKNNENGKWDHLEFDRIEKEENNNYSRNKINNDHKKSDRKQNYEDGYGYGSSKDYMKSDSRNGHHSKRNNGQKESASGSYTNSQNGQYQQNPPKKMDQSKQNLEKIAYPDKAGSDKQGFDKSAPQSAEKFRIQDSNKKPDRPLYKVGSKNSGVSSSKDTSTQGNDEVLEEKEKEIPQPEKVKQDKSTKIQGSEDFSHDNSIDSTTAMSENRQNEFDTCDLKSENVSSQVGEKLNVTLQIPFDFMLKTPKDDRTIKIEQLSDLDRYLEPISKEFDLKEIVVISIKINILNQLINSPVTGEAAQIIRQLYQNLIDNFKERDVGDDEEKGEIN